MKVDMGFRAFYALLLFWTMPALAQKVPAVPKYYVGVAWMRDASYEVLYSAAANLSGAGPWQIIAGGQLSQRFSLQIGYTYSHDRYDQNPYYTGVDTMGVPFSGTRLATKTTHALPMLLRYAVLNPLASPVKFRALLGTTLLHADATLHETAKIADQVVSEFYIHQYAWQLYATGGLEVGYQFGQHLEAAAALTWSKNVESAPEYIHQMTTGNPAGITSAFALGLRYGFNPTKLARTAP